VKEKIADLLLQSSVNDLRAQLVTYEVNPDSASPGAKGNFSMVLETFFVKKAINSNDALRWNNCQVATTAFSLEGSNDDVSWKAFTMNVTARNSSKAPTYVQIAASPNEVFYMNDPVYPFVDCFWYDESTQEMNAGQASKSFSGHPKSVDTCMNMLDKLQIPPGKKLVINIIPLPSQADGYAIGTRGEFFTNVEEDEDRIREICQRLEFRVIKMSL